MTVRELMAVLTTADPGAYVEIFAQEIGVNVGIDCVMIEAGIAEASVILYTE